MLLTITSGEKPFSIDFIKWLLRRIRIEIISSINKKKFIKFNQEIINNNLFNQNVLLTTIDVCKAVFIGANNLKCVKVKNTYHIFIDKTVMYPNSTIPVYLLCKYVNYGNYSVSGYPIFTNVFNHVKSNLGAYYYKYLRFPW